METFIRYKQIPGVYKFNIVATSLVDIVRLTQGHFVYALQGDDSVWATSPGIDSAISGGSGNDTYNVSKQALALLADAGGGLDQIIMTDLSYSEAHESWMFIEIDDRHLMMTDGESGSVMIADYKTDASAIESIEFSDGTVFTLNELLQDVKARDVFYSQSLSETFTSLQYYKINKYLNTYQAFNVQYELEAVIPALTGVIEGGFIEKDTLSIKTSLDHLIGWEFKFVHVDWMADGEVVSSRLLTGETDSSSGELRLYQNHVGKEISAYIYSEDKNNAFSEKVLVATGIRVENRNDEPWGGTRIFEQHWAAQNMQIEPSTQSITDRDGISFFGYQWFADGKPLLGERSKSLTLDQEHVGKNISVEVRYVDDWGTVESFMTPSTSPIREVNDLPQGYLLIEGRLSEGEVVTIKNHLSDLDGMGELHYQWQIDGVDLIGETENTLSLTSEYVGTVVSVVASYQDQAGFTETVRVSTNDTVAENNNPPTGFVNIVGNVEAGNELTLEFSIDDVDGVGSEFGYQWYADDKLIAGADHQNYIVADEDAGKQLSAAVIYTDEAGLQEQVRSSVTEPVSRLINGIVGQGNIQGAAIYIDQNNNYKADKEEFTGSYTNSEGEFSLRTELSGRLIVEGGVNTDSRLPNLLSLSAPAGSEAINLITTLLEQLDGNHLLVAELLGDLFDIGPDLDLRSANDQVLESLDLIKLNAQLEFLAIATGDQGIIPSMAALLPRLISGEIDSDLADPGFVNALLFQEYDPLPIKEFDPLWVLDHDPLLAKEYDPLGRLTNSLKRVEAVTSSDALKSTMRNELLGEEHEVAGLYSAIFNRAPDASGMEHWLNNLYNFGSTLNGLSGAFVRHPVFIDTYGGMDNTQFVEAIYKNMLGAAGDQGGINYWINHLSNGMTYADMVADFVQGALRVDLNEMFDNGSLTQEEFDAAVNRQDHITYRSLVAVEFVHKLDDETKVTYSGSDVVNDPAYIASIAILENINENHESYWQAIEVIDSSLNEDNPVDYINTWANSADLLI